MKVVLRQDVPNLGSIGDVVTVKDGYARNYLIPRGLAYYASPKALKIIEQEKKQYEQRKQQEILNAQQLAERLESLQITIPMKVGESGRLFGSVTAQMIANELELRGYPIDRRSIIIDEPIKSLGLFDVKVRLHSEVTATLKIWVINEEESTPTE